MNRIEEKIVATLIDKVTKDCNTILSSYNDGEVSYLFRNTKSIKSMVSELDSSGMDTLKFQRLDTPERFIFVVLIYGNGDFGMDLVSDYTAVDDLEKAINETMDIVQDWLVEIAKTMINTLENN